MRLANPLIAVDRGFSLSSYLSRLALFGLGTFVSYTHQEEEHRHPHRRTHAINDLVSGRVFHLDALPVLKCSQRSLVILSQVLGIFALQTLGAHARRVLVFGVAASGERLGPRRIREVHHRLFALRLGVAKHNPHLRANLLDGPASDLSARWRCRRRLVLAGCLDFDLIDCSLHGL